MTEKERIISLRKELHQYNYYYYIENTSQISDQMFDTLMTELIKLERLHPEMDDPNSPTKRVGSDLNNKFTQVQHEFPMLSLGNTYEEQEVRTFYQRIQSILRKQEFEICCELKFDGLSISLIYEEGQLVRAVTRGDGAIGDDVTENVRTIKSIPLYLKGKNFPSKLEIRGEIVLPWKAFEIINSQRINEGKEPFANPRNAASGTLKNKNSKVVANRRLDAYFYAIPHGERISESHYISLQKVKKWGFKVSNEMICTKNIDEILDFIEEWSTKRSELPVATDGVVLKVDAYNLQDQIGYTAKFPRWAIAYKFTAERVRTRLLEVTYQVGRTGAITPVANMEPVVLAGTIVKRASLHNENIIQQLNLHIGDMVYIEKAGEIIPQIVGVDTTCRETDKAKEVRFVTHCPDCGTKLIKYGEETTYYCPNETDCPTQLKGRIEHFISRDCMNIDSLGPETIDDYFQRGIIHTVADLYKLRIEDIAGTDNNRIISACKIVDAIAKSREVSFERVLFALGIRFVGKVVAKNLVHHFRTIDAIRIATLEHLLEIEGVGKKIANSLQSYFSNVRNQRIIEELRQAGVRLEIEERKLSSELLEGKAIVISGTFMHHSRDEYKRLIEEHGGKNTGSISKKTSFLLAGKNIGPSKLEKVQSLGIPVISEEEFLQIIEEVSL